MKFSGVNLAKLAQDLYAENYKLPIEENKGQNKWGVVSSLQIDVQD